MGCIDENQVAELIDGLLPERERLAIDEHVDNCSRCRAVIGAVARNAAAPEPKGGTLVGAPPSSARPLDPTPTGGVVLCDRYELSRQLGAGGMGSVWAATDRRLRREVAVKLLVPRSPAAAIERFEREAVAIARLRSPHIVQVYDYGVSGQTPFLVMELFEGEDLGRRLKRVDRLPLGAVMDLVVAVAKGLTAAHERGIVHRDLKPTNIFLVRSQGEEVVKIFDFGVAKVLDDRDQGVTVDGMLVGTPRYASPEQLMGSQALDWRADLWALGVTAYQALTGRVPFRGHSLGELVAEILYSTAPPPTSLCEGLPPEIDDFFTQALAKSPEQRFLSAAQMAMALATVAGEELSSGEFMPVEDPEGLSSRARRSVPRAVSSPRISIPPPSTDTRMVMLDAAPPPAKQGMRLAVAAATAAIVAVGITLVAVTRAPAESQVGARVAPVATTAAVVTAAKPSPRPSASATAATSATAVAPAPSVRPLAAPRVSAPANKTKAPAAATKDPGPFANPW